MMRQITEAFSIAESWLNDATFFPQTIVSANSTLARTDWVDTTLSGWQSSVEPLALGLTSAISELLKDSAHQEGSGLPEEEIAIPVGMIATLLRSFIGSYGNTTRSINRWFSWHRYRYSRCGIASG